MDYQQKFTHPKLPNELIILEWERGYRNLIVWYREKVIFQVDNPKNLLKGEKFVHEILGDVELRLTKDPYVLNLIIAGYHSPSNNLHPKHRIVSVSNWFILPILIFGFSASFLFVDIFSTKNRFIGGENFILMSIYFVLTAIYLTSFILIRLKRAAFFFVGFGTYLLFGCLLITICLLSNLSTDELIFWIITFTIYFGYALAMGFSAKLAYSAIRHKQMEKYQHNETIDL